MNVRPFLRWAGGKQNIAKNLLKYVPRELNKERYFEPFLGGGSLFFLLQPKKAFLSDMNQHLIHCYEVIKKHPSLFHRHLSRLQKFTNEKDYYHIRDEFNIDINNFSVVQAARFVYLNRSCYNGIFRVNKRGLFNVPYGKKNPYYPTFSEIKNISRILQSATLCFCSYEKILPKLKSGDFIYLDPPYPPLNGTSYFTHYTKERFSKNDQIKVLEIAESLRKKNCFILITNADTKEIRELYSNCLDESYNSTIICKNRRN